MAKLTGLEAAEKHARRLTGATEDIRQGVERVTVAPGQLAAAKVDKMRQNLLASIDDGTWATNVAKVTVGEWKDDMLNKGVNRIGPGVTAAIPKTAVFFSELFEHQDKIVAEINNMPDLSLEDNIGRMVHNARRMAEFKKS